MPVDYSKWDALELSDDSDIEVHPNVDKKSFIRAKQNQIHQQRAQRRHQIGTLKYERIINDGLLLRIDRLLTALKSHKASSQSADELVFQALIESAGDPTDDRPPPPPEGVHQNVQEQPTYSKMMASLVDQVKKEVDQKKSDDRYESYIQGIGEHRSKVEGLQKELLVKLAELEKEEKKHITSDDLHEGFNFSNVTPKGIPAPAAKSSGKTTESVELLNAPGSRPPLKSTDTGQSSGADADVEDGPDPDAADNDDDDESLRPTTLGKAFGKIAVGDYQASLQFISKHPEILTERESDGLLVQAFDKQMEGHAKEAKQCVNQALLIQYCRQLGKDGVGLFFRRITTQGHQAGKLFTDDVNDTYNKIKVRVVELAKEKADRPEGEEQIQLHAVDPNTKINIIVPPPIPTNLAAESTQPPPSEDQIAARKIFETFPPGLQRALESGSLDEVNRVLGKMSVEEAEEVVGQLGEGGMLNLEENVIDATTEEGKNLVKEIERTGRLPGGEKDAIELSEVPPMD
ncbi:Hsp90 co-chaperone Cdc37 [Tothia fuscella]|uniref:Hsp90 chaperone protein kinase-targeting subunit n=1 Tax=Tothia fuscella TaxID=1048955 RepID=A0A9P4NTS0_9PEZI|nr:Hsp90 co-chaperone Cdc37 [Tothia fuscella]